MQLYELASWLAERAEQLARRKAIYEALHPETRKGVVQAIKMHRKLGHDVAVQNDKYVSDNLSLTYPSYTFSEDTANKTGISKRSIEREVQIATRIPDDVRELLRATPVAERSPKPTPTPSAPLRQGLRQRAKTARMVLSRRGIGYPRNPEKTAWRGYGKAWRGLRRRPEVDAGLTTASGKKRRGNLERSRPKNGDSRRDFMPSSGFQVVG